MNRILISIDQLEAMEAEERAAAGATSGAPAQNDEKTEEEPCGIIIRYRTPRPC